MNVNCPLFLLFAFIQIPFISGLVTAQELSFDEPDAERQGMTWSGCVRDLSDGKILFSREKHRLMTPASNLKIVTTGIALNLLGPGYRYKTSVALRGHRGKHSSWQGDLIIDASGDPTLGSNQWPDRAAGKEIFTPVIEALKDLGLTKIEGDLIVYSGSYDARSHNPSWPWSDLANYFGIDARALNFHDNSYSLFLSRSNRPGDSVEVLRTVPPLDYSFDCRVTVGSPGSGDNAWIYGAPRDDSRLIRGSIPPGSTPFRIRGSVGLPGRWFGTLLKKALNREGVELAGRIKINSGTHNGRGLQELHAWRSPPLKEIVEITNRESVNLYAEGMLKTIGMEVGNEATTEAGIAEVEKYLQTNIDRDINAFFVDGSGLAPDNGLSTGLMTAFLCHFFDYRANSSGIDSFLPKVGLEGTVSRMELSGGTAWLKSGSLNQSKAYSGIIRRRDGSYIACSVMVNHFGKSPGRADRLCRRFIQQIASSQE